MLDHRLLAINLYASSFGSNLSSAHIPSPVGQFQALNRCSPCFGARFLITEETAARFPFRADEISLRKLPAGNDSTACWASFTISLLRSKSCNHYSNLRIKSTKKKFLFRFRKWFTLGDIPHQFNACAYFIRVLPAWTTRSGISKWNLFIINQYWFITHKNRLDQYICCLDHTHLTKNSVTIHHGLRRLRPESTKVKRCEYL